MEAIVSIGPVAVTAWLAVHVIDGATAVPVMLRAYAKAGVATVVAAVIAAVAVQIMSGA